MEMGIRNKFMLSDNSFFLEMHFLADACIVNV
jgi:hypothetical protein